MTTPIEWTLPDDLYQTLDDRLGRSRLRYHIMESVVLSAGFSYMEQVNKSIKTLL